MGSNSDDPHDLSRFVDAQRSIYDQAIAELRTGRKRTHWIWFVFPQIQGLGFSGVSKRHAINSLDEARAYLAHPVLGPRLRECTKAVLHNKDKSASAIFGYPDDLKFRSSLTLFAQAEPGSEFDQALAAFFGGAPDDKTLEILQRLREFNPAPSDEPWSTLGGRRNRSSFRN